MKAWLTGYMPGLDRRVVCVDGLTIRSEDGGIEFTARRTSRRRMLVMRLWTTVPSVGQVFVKDVAPGNSNRIMEK